MGTLLLPFAYIVLQIGRLLTMTNVVLTHIKKLI
jgi:hypothetical protein